MQNWQSAPVKRTQLFYVYIQLNLLWGKLKYTVSLQWKLTIMSPPKFYLGCFLRLLDDKTKAQEPASRACNRNETALARCCSGAFFSPFMHILHIVLLSEDGLQQMTSQGRWKTHLRQLKKKRRAWWITCLSGLDDKWLSLVFFGLWFSSLVGRCAMAQPLADTLYTTCLPICFRSFDSWPFWRRVQCCPCLWLREKGCNQIHLWIWSGVAHHIYGRVWSDCNWKVTRNGSIMVGIKQNMFQIKWRLESLWLCIDMTIVILRVHQFGFWIPWGIAHGST